MTRHLKTAAFVVALAWARLGNAQGTFENANPLQLNQPIFFTAHLTSNSEYTGDGTFQLSGNRLSYEVIVPYGLFEAGIYGPAAPGVEGPLIFMLHPTACNAPIGSEPGFCLFSDRPSGVGALYLSDPQITDLLGGLWYVGAGNPPYMQGQILQVPEPLVSRLAAFTFACCWTCQLCRVWSRNRATN